jgi:membrane peptidoglycan carboxypeptidase
VAATLASGGMWCPPNPIDKVFDRRGTEVSVTTETCEQVVPEGLANTLANALSKDDQGAGTAAGSAGSVGWDLPMSGKTGTTEAHRSSAFLGFTNTLAAANYIYDDSTDPGDLCSFPLRQCGSGDLFGGNEPARTWFTAMKPIANNFGPVSLPPTDPRFVDGAPGSRVPSVAGMNQDLARTRLREAGFQVADQTSSVNSGSSAGSVVGTSPSGATVPGSIITLQVSNGIPPAPPPPPAGQIPGLPPVAGSTVVEIPGLPPITVPVLGPPPPAPPPPP